MTKRRSAFVSAGIRGFLQRSIWTVPGAARESAQRRARPAGDADASQAVSGEEPHVCRGAGHARQGRRDSHRRPGPGPRPGMKISVVVPAFNEEKLLPEALRAIRAAMSVFDDAELIVCDNNSTDRT